MKIVIIGLGGLGGYVANALKKHDLLLIDRDIVVKSNIPRQILFKSKDIGKSKALVAGLKLKKKWLDLDYFDSIEIKDYDLVFDCTDNFETHVGVNRVCKAFGIPYIMAGAVLDRGFVFYSRKHDPCIECWLSDKTFLTCATEGILSNTLKMVSELMLKKKPGLFWIDCKLNKITEYKVIKKNCDGCKGIPIKRKIVPRLACGGEYIISSPKHKSLYSPKSMNIKVLPSGAIRIKAKSQKEARIEYAKHFG